jgi:hypothetical protein
MFYICGMDKVYPTNHYQNVNGVFKKLKELIQMHSVKR